MIEKSPTVSHEQFKGALYIILQNQLLVRTSNIHLSESELKAFKVKHNWRLQYRLWPQLVTAQHSEKPSITALVKSITGYIHR